MVMMCDVCRSLMRSSRAPGGGFSRPAGTRHQDNAIPQIGDFTQLHRQSEAGELRNLGRNYAHDNSATAALDKNVDAKASYARQSEGDIAGALLPQHVDRLLVVADEVRGNAAGIVRAQQSQSRTLHWNQLAIHSTCGGRPGRRSGRSPFRSHPAFAVSKACVPDMPNSARNRA